MNKINWELKIDGVVDLDELDHIAERIKTGALEGTVFVDLEETHVTPTCKKVPMPDGLQEFIDDLSLKILYSNFHKSTNGTWSRAEVVDHGTFEPNFGVETEKEYWEVGVSYGKADDCGSEDYYEKVCVWEIEGIGFQYAWRYNLPEVV